MGSETTLNSSSSDFGELKANSDENENENETEESPEEQIDPRTLLTVEQVQQYKMIFAALDSKSQGKIPTKVLGTIIRSLGHNPTKAHIKEFMLAADPEETGLMDFQGFLLPLAQIINTVPETFDDILLAFRTLDESDLGYITTDELIEYMITLGEYMEDFEIEAFIKLADPKGEGKIMYEEFLEKLFDIQKKNQKAGKAGKAGKSGKTGKGRKKK